jgi:outer membrane protein TolC
MRLNYSNASGLAFLASTLVLAGCATPDDPYNKRPAPAVPYATRTAIPEASKSAASPPPFRPTGLVQASATMPSVPTPQSFTPTEAVRFTLENNPQLHAVREQRGFAQGGVVIARTYPYNPVIQIFEWGVGGPSSSGITNRAFNETTIRLDLELRGQGTHRRAAAGAVVTRTEWEIATQEVLVSVAATRAFNTVLHRAKRLEVLEDTVKLNEEVMDQVKKLVDLGRLRPADLILAKTELDGARAQLGQGKTALTFARADLRRQFGTFDDSFEVKGELDLPVPTMDFKQYEKAALEQRPDLQARRAMVEEAQARLRLQMADRYGNPSVGPAFEYNETRDTFVGIWFFSPMPILNTRQGEIKQAQAMVARSLADVRQLEIQSAQDVQAALARLEEARKWVESYTAEVLPSLKKADQDMRKLLDQNDPGVDVLKVIGVQRNYLLAFSNYLDALLELSQARADLAAAVGDPALALGLYPSNQKPAPEPNLLPAPKPAPALPKGKG